MLEDPATSLVGKHIPEPTAAEAEQMLLDAQKLCFQHGITSLTDAGLSKKQVDLIDNLQQTGKLKMQIYAMLSPTKENLEHFLDKGHYKTERLNVRSFKIYADGALGSRGAYLLEPYSDMPETKGILITDEKQLRTLINQMADADFQVNTHCIGDASNRMVLDVYGDELGEGNDKRWRIEHAQIVHPDDLKKYKKYKVIPSVQPTHCTSDMLWADERLGEERIKTAYAYKQLYEQNNMIAFGTDFPVESVNQIYTFHAATARQNSDHEPEGGFQMENAMDKKAALRAMTIWAAYANFEENEKGSIEAGKSADFIVLDTDIMDTHPRLLRNTVILQTFVKGEEVYNIDKE